MNFKGNYESHTEQLLLLPHSCYYYWCRPRWASHHINITRRWQWLEMVCLAWVFKFLCVVPAKNKKSKRKKLVNFSGAQKFQNKYYLRVHSADHYHHRLVCNASNIFQFQMSHTFIYYLLSGLSLNILLQQLKCIQDSQWTASCWWLHMLGRKRKNKWVLHGFFFFFFVFDLGFW